MAKVDEVYQNLLKDILENGTRKSDRTGTGTVSVFGRQIRFNMGDGFPMLTTKKMFMKGVTTELLWFLSGETNIKPLVEQGNMIWVGDAYKKYCNQPNFLGHEDIPDKEWFINEIKTNQSFADKFGELGPVYGKQWVDWGGYEINSGEAIEGLNKGINQIQNIIDTLKANPTSRRIMVNAWNPSDIDKMTLPPCHYGFQFNTVELTNEEREKLYVKHCMENNWVLHIGRGMTRTEPFVMKDSYESDYIRAEIPKHKLSLMWNQRSVDTFLGLPFNITSYALLLHMVAQQVNMVPHELIGSLGDTHLYSNHMEQVDELLSREPMELPTLYLKKADSIFNYSYDDINIMNYSSHPTIKAPLSN